MIDFERDMSVFFNTDEFAVSATLADGRHVPIIFDTQPEGVDYHGREVVSDTQVCRAKAADVAGLAIGAQLTVAGKVWAVASLPQSDAADGMIMTFGLSPC